MINIRLFGVEWKYLKPYNFVQANFNYKLLT